MIMKKIAVLCCLAATAFSLAAQEVFNEAKFIAKGRELEWARKTHEALKHYQSGLKEKLSPYARRLLLNRCAMLARGREAQKNYLLQACMVKGGDPTEIYRTHQLLGYIYERESPDKALGYYLNFGNEKKVHPGLVYSGYLSAGRILERKKKYSEALKYYNKALGAGKAVTYKFNYSAAEKAIQKVEALVKK